MSEFLATVLGFPTLVYSMVLAFCVMYWLLAATGLVDIDGLDMPDAGDAEGLAGIFAKAGLDRVPLMVVLTLLAFFGWLCTYFVHLFLLGPLWGWLRWLLGAAVAVGALVPAVLVTALVLRPVRGWLLSMQPAEPASILGKVAVVRSPEVSTSAGSADFHDGGAGLVLQVRCDADARIPRGERVVLLEYIPAEHAYRVMREGDYLSL